MGWNREISNCRVLGVVCKAEVDGLAGIALGNADLRSRFSLHHGAAELSQHPLCLGAVPLSE